MARTIQSAYSKANRVLGLMKKHLGHGQMKKYESCIQYSSGHT